MYQLSSLVLRESIPPFYSKDQLAEGDRQFTKEFWDMLRYQTRGRIGLKHIYTPVISQ
jgi:hypothetical protein